MPNQLMEPLLDNGILNSYFFNGRILDADALKTDQQANRRQHGQLGRAIGEGIAWGLEVTVESAGSVSAPAVVKVGEGLAINRRGQALELAVSGLDPTQCTSGAGIGATDSISLALAKTTGPAPTGSDLFTLCTIADPTVATLAGVYLLVMSPASGFRGSAPMKSLSVSGKDVGCGSRYAVEGVTFRLVGFPSEGQALGDVQTLQNRLAHRCFGTEEQLQGRNGLPSFDHDPFDFFGDYGAIDILRDNGALTDCDVPLALIYQTQAGVQFCDMWAVRRPIVSASAPGVWPLHIGARRLAEGMAMFVQFQAQMDALFQTASNRNLTAAKDNFRYLPPAGYLRTGAGEFDETHFFADLTTQRFNLDPAFLRLMVASSHYLDPIDLSAANPPQVALYESAAADGYLLFTRLDASSPIVVNTQPGGPVDPGVASLDVYVRLSDVKILLPEQAAKLVKVTAKDANGVTHQGKAVALPKFLTFNAVSRLNTQLHFTFPELPAGVCLVTVGATKYTTVKRNVTLEAGAVARVSVTLNPFERPTGKTIKPSAVLAGNWLEHMWYKSAVSLDKKIDWQARADLPTWTVQPDPPPDVAQQLQQQADWLQQQNPDAPIDPTDIRILVDPTYTPDQIPNDFYAYLQFGENGAYVPLLLTATDKTLDRPVSLGKGSLAGVDTDMIAQLAAAGVGDLSLLAASPKALVAEALNLSPDAGQGLITAGRGAVATLKNSVLQFNGVTDQTRQVLAGLNITDAVTLANADPATLQAKLGDAAFAGRLVEEARASVSPELWSVGAKSLGLSVGEITGLHTIGVVTLGQVAAQQTAGTAAKLGLPDAEVTKVVTAFQGVSTRLQTEQANKTPVASLTTVDPASALTLASAGLTDVGKLATADVATVAAQLNGKTELATRIVAEAQSAQKRVAAVH